MTPLATAPAAPTAANPDPSLAYLAAKLAAVTAMIEVTVRAMRGEAPEPGTAAHGALLAAIEADTEATRLAAAHHDAEPVDANGVPAIRLRGLFGLTDGEDHVLWVLIAHALCPDARALIRALGGEALPDATGDALRRVVHGSAPSRDAWTELSQDGALRRLELVERTDGGGAEIPIYRQTFHVSPRILALIHGVAGLDPALGSFARRVADPRPIDRLVIGDGVAARALTCVAMDPGLVLVTGDRGTGRRSVLAAAAGAHGLELLEVDARALADDPARLAHELRTIVRECRLFGLVPLVRDLDVLAGAGAADRLAVVDRELVRARSVVLATARRDGARYAWSRAAQVIELPALTGAQRVALWQAELPGLHARDVEHLATTYPMSPALIVGAGAAARAGADGALRAHDIRHGIRAVLDDRLAGLATRLEITQRWDDLVVPDDQLVPIQELVARIRRRRTVYEDWGFANKVGKGLGVSALFSGPPGTGKTMVAGLIASDVGTEIYRVDLAKIVSKWIGETEQHLAALFDAAEAGHAVILFDEADALFAKRTEVRSSNDRYANLEVNYLLQRLETFTGICILTTNHESTIDDAFRRRLSLHLRFALPDLGERARLWRALLPPQAPVAADLEVERLAARFEMSGGHIRNAVLRAAFLAADEESMITEHHLARGARVEYESMGRIARAA